MVTEKTLCAEPGASALNTTLATHIKGQQMDSVSADEDVQHVQSNGRDTGLNAANQSIQDPSQGTSPQTVDLRSSSWSISNSTDTIMVVHLSGH